MIEDDPDIAALVAEMVAELGHEVAHFATLEGAGGPACLVITDLVQLTAFEPAVARAFVTRVRERFPGAPVVVATAHGPAATTGADGLGADAVLLKPFDFPLFSATVGRLLPR